MHSRYLRAVSDLPWHGICAALKVGARCFFCDEAPCERRIFCERLPGIAVRARKTGRMEEALLAIALELGGRAGTRLVAELGLLTGRDALLERAKGAPPADHGKVRVLGVDDFPSGRRLRLRHHPRGPRAARGGGPAAGALTESAEAPKLRPSGG